MNFYICRWTYFRDCKNWSISSVWHFIYCYNWQHPINTCNTHHISMVKTKDSVSWRRFGNDTSYCLKIFTKKEGFHSAMWWGRGWANGCRATKSTCALPKILQCSVIKMESLWQRAAATNVYLRNVSLVIAFWSYWLIGCHDNTKMVWCC
jgi:hypothetical protein